MKDVSISRSALGTCCDMERCPKMQGKECSTQSVPSYSGKVNGWEESGTRDASLVQQRKETPTADMFILPVPLCPVKALCLFSSEFISV